MAGGAVSVQKPYACHEGGFGWGGSCGRGSVSQKGKPQISEPPVRSWFIGRKPNSIEILGEAHFQG